MRKTYTIIIDFSPGSYEETAEYYSPWQELIRGVTKRLTSASSVRRESAKAELVSISSVEA